MPKIIREVLIVKKSSFQMSSPKKPGRKKHLGSLDSLFHCFSSLSENNRTVMFITKDGHLLNLYLHFQKRNIKRIFLRFLRTSIHRYEHIWNKPLHETDKNV